MWWILFTISMIVSIFSLTFAFKNPKGYGVFIMRNLWLTLEYSLVLGVLLFIFDWKATLITMGITTVILLSTYGVFYLTPLKNWYEAILEQYLDGIASIDHNGATEMDWRGLYIKH